MLVRYSFRHFDLIGTTPTLSEPLASLDRARAALQVAATTFAATQKKPVVVVLDNVNRLPIRILENLQDWAKDSADNRSIQVVFVASEGSVPRQFQSRSAWSRARWPPIEIGDLDDQQAIHYLTNRRIEPCIAKEVVQYVSGGRLLLLSTAVQALHSGVSMQVLKAGALAKAHAQFLNAGLLTTTPHKDSGVKLAKVLLASPTKQISFHELTRLITDASHLDSVLRHQIFSYHPASSTVTFQSRPTQRFAEIEWQNNNESERFCMPD